MSEGRWKCACFSWNDGKTTISHDCHIHGNPDQQVSECTCGTTSAYHDMRCPFYYVALTEFKNTGVYPPKPPKDPQWIRCAKCGSTSIAVKYFKNAIVYLDGRPQTEKEDCLQLTCPCGYSWTRPCLDAKA